MRARGTVLRGLFEKSPHTPKNLWKIKRYTHTDFPARYLRRASAVTINERLSLADKLEHLPTERSIPMKHLLLLVPRLKQGGQERVAAITAQVMRDEYDITFVIFDGEDAVMDPGCPVTCIDIPAGNNIPRKIINAFRRARAVKRIKRENKIDVSFSFGTTANIVNALSRANDRILASVTGFGSVSANKAKRLFWRIIYGMCDGVVPVADSLADEVARAYSVPREKLFTVYNPYDDADVARQCDMSVDIDIPTPAVVSVGRQNHVKGYHHLIGAVAKAKAKVPALSLVLVGDGEENASLRDHAARLGITDSVIFAGYQASPSAYSSKCTAYVLSSISEGFPCAMVEAMACGLPVVSVDCKTGPREILTDKFENKTATDIELGEYGILTPPFSADKSDEAEREQILADAIAALLSDSELTAKYSAASRARAAEFTLAAYKKRMGEVLGG